MIDFSKMTLLTLAAFRSFHRNSKLFSSLKFGKRLCSPEQCVVLCSSNSFSFLIGGMSVMEHRNCNTLPTWNTTLAEGRQILEEKYGYQQTASSFNLLLPTEHIVKRLQSAGNNNKHLVNIFRNLLCDFHLSTHWPGIVTLLLAKAGGNPLPERDFSSHEMEEATWQSQMIVADVVNLLQGNITFQAECQNLPHPRRQKQDNTQKHFTELVNSYSTSAALSKIGSLNNCKAAWLISSALGSLAASRSQNPISQNHCDVLHTLDDWEYSAFHPQGVLLTKGCQAALELSSHGKTVQRMALDFAKHLVLALKAHSDIHHFMQYQISETSYLKFSSLPVVLHLENNPELLAYIYSCGSTLDNLDHHLVFSEVQSGTALPDASKLLESYIHAAVQILKEFSSSPEKKNLVKLTESLRNVNNWSFNNITAEYKANMSLFDA